MMAACSRACGLESADGILCVGGVDLSRRLFDRYVMVESSRTVLEIVWTLLTLVALVLDG
jgi:hypothetical protein